MAGPAFRTAPARGAVAAVLVAAVLGGCATYYDTYREAHPGWKLEFPKAGLDLEEVLASISAPRELAPFGDGHARRVVILEGEAPPWHEVPVEDVESGRFVSDPGASYLVGVRVGCTAPGYNMAFFNDVISLYLLERNALVSFRHVSFFMLCHGAIEHESPERISEEQEERIRCLLTGRCRAE